MILPFLLLRDDTQTDHRPERKPHTTRSLLTKRLLLAEQCKFSQLIHEASLFEKAASTRASASRLGARPRSEILQAVADRAEDGCLRVASRMLRGDQVLESFD